MSKEMVKDEPKNVKMCAERIKGNKVVKKVSNKTNATSKTSKKMRAAFLKSKVWPANTTINIGFLNTFDPDDIARTSTATLKKKVDRNGVALKLDPLQEEVEDMSVQNAIIYTILKRFNDVVYPEYKPKSVVIDPNHKPEPLINIKLNFFDPTDPSRKKLFNPNLADIRIDFDPEGGAWSLLGTDCLTEDKQNATMNFGWFDIPTTCHEMCHALGMVHEHSNPAGKPINWSVCHVTQWANSTQGWDAVTIKENIIEKYKADQINGSEFDPLSIMLYFFPGSVVCKDNPDGTVPDVSVSDVEKCFKGCKVNKGGLTACNKDLDDCPRPGNGTAQNLRFSPFDILYLNNTYPSDSSSLSPEQLTVKFYNDNYGEQVNIDSLSNQLKLTKERESGTKAFAAKDTFIEPVEEESDEEKKDTSILNVFLYAIAGFVLVYYSFNYLIYQPAKALYNFANVNPQVSIGLLVIIALASLYKEMSSVIQKEKDKIASKV